MRLSPLKKITGILAISCLVALILLVAYLYSSLRESATKQWVENKASYTLQLASWIDRELTQAQKRLESIANRPEFRQPLNAALIDRSLNGIPQGVDMVRRNAFGWLRDERDHAFSVLFLLLPNGDHYISHPYSVQKTLKTYNLSQRSYFQEARETKKPVISDSFIGADGIRAVAIDIPILDSEGKILAHLGGVFHLSGLARLFDTPNPSPVTETTFLLDSKGSLISRSSDTSGINITSLLLKAPEVNQSLSTLSSVDTASHYQIGTKQIQLDRGQYTLMLIRLTSGWTLGHSSELRSVTAQFNTNILRIAALAALLLSVIGGLGIYAVTRIGLRWQGAEERALAANDGLERRVIQRTAELSANEENLRTTLNSIGDAVISTDLHGLVTNMNPISEALTGWTMEEALGRPLEHIFNIVNSKTKERAANPLHHVFETGEIVGLADHTLLIGKEGKEYQIADSAAPVRNNNGYITGVVLVFRDITEEYQVRTALEESEARFQDFAETAADLFWEMDSDLRFSYISGKVEKVMGFGVTSIIGYNRQEIYRDYNLIETPGFRAHQHQLEERLPFADFEVKWRAKNGQMHILSIAGKPLFDDNNNFTGYRGVTRDITARKRAQAALRNTENRLQAILDYAPALISTKDLDGNVTLLNKRFEDIIGPNPESVLGRNVYDLFPRDVADSLWQNDLSARAGALEVEEEVEHLDGSQHTYLTVKFPFTDEHKKLLGTCAISTDITERKQARLSLEESEAKFRSIFESSVVGMIVVIDGKGDITEWNKGAQVTFGYTAEEAVGSPLTMLMPERYRDSHSKGFFHAVAQGGLSSRGKTYELEGVRNNGEEFPLELTLGSWTIGKELYFSAIILDITQRKQAEEALRRTQKMDAIGRMAGGIAHDFNNILGIIIGNLNLLKRRIPDDEKALKRVDTIKKSAQRAANLTKQLLGFSRRQAEQVAITDINRIIGNMDSLIARSITPVITVKHQLAPNLWTTEIDPGDFEDALLNLIINARDAMASGGQLILETSNFILNDKNIMDFPEASCGDYVRLAVIDNGDGISAEQHEKIFEPFFTTKPQGKGTGLGLAMVFGFVERSGGHITLTSEVGHGSTFYILLPRSIDKIENREESEEGQKEPTVLPRGSEVILVVDDEEGLLDLAKESLESLGYQVLIASSGQEAIDIFSSTQRISLLFSDVVMPGGINGFNLAEVALASHPELKILLTSGYTDKEPVQNGQARFTANLLDKPYTQDELARRIRAALGDLEEELDTSCIENAPSKNSNEWSDDLSVSIKPIDNDHQLLFSMLNSCQAAMKSDLTQEEIYRLLKELLAFTKTHFEREERIMLACNYPGFNNHQQVHQLLIKQLEKMQDQLIQGSLTCHQFADFITSWLIDHIQGMDRAITPYAEGKQELVQQVIEQLETVPDERPQS